LLDKAENDIEYEELKTILTRQPELPNQSGTFEFFQTAQDRKTAEQHNSLVNEVHKNSKFIIGDKRIL